MISIINFKFNHIHTYICIQIGNVASSLTHFNQLQKKNVYVLMKCTNKKQESIKSMKIKCDAFTS